MTHRPLRCVYRHILRLHPAPFRDRFSDEMLWIFDEERKHGACARLFFDAAWSLARQRAKPRRECEEVPVGFGILALDSSIGVPRIFQALLLALLLFVGFIRFVRSEYPSHFYAHRPDCSLSAIFTLQSPAPNTPPETFKLHR